MEQLTKTEEQIMQIIWKLKRALVRDVMEELGPPEPKYTTISSIIRILEKKGFVGHKAYGRTHEYFPLITKEAYKRHSFQQLLTNYFEGSYKDVVSFMVEEETLSEDEIAAIQAIIDKHSES